MGIDSGWLEFSRKLARQAEAGSEGLQGPKEIRILLKSNEKPLKQANGF